MTIRRRRWHWFAASSVLVTLVAFLTCASIAGAQQRAAQSKAAQVAALPNDGATISQVSDSLVRANVEHSYDEASRAMYAMIRGSKLRMVTTDYQILFLFDEHGRLASRKVTEKHTGW